MPDKLEPTIEGDFTFVDPFLLDGGGQLTPVTQHYAVYGDLARQNVLLVCHALSGSARVATNFRCVSGERLGDGGNVA